MYNREYIANHTLATQKEAAGDLSNVNALNSRTGSIQLATQAYLARRFVELKRWLGVRLVWHQLKSIRIAEFDVLASGQDPPATDSLVETQ